MSLLPRFPAGERSSRRGAILIAVLVVVVISALAGTTAMYYGDAATSASLVSLKRTRSRAMAWSGVQAVMSELDGQRDKLLDGENPLITTQWQLFEQEGKRGVVRLVALEKDDAGLERWLVSENARLDLNAATEEMLGRLGPLNEMQAAAIIAARGEGFASIEELVKVEGLSELLASTGIDAAERENSLAPLLTVFSFDPNVQAGIDPGGADARGKLRVNLNTPWSDDLADAIRQRFGSDAANSAKALFDAGEKFKSMADLIRILRRTGPPVETWPAIIDTFTVSPDPFIPGRIDINQASAAVLASIPGISVEAADEIVKRRGGLDSSLRRSIAWPLSEGILTQEEFQRAVDWMTTRSMQWRVRVEVGILGMEDQGRDAPALEERMVVEAVIDVASERPRVAYLRDVTLSDAAAGLARSLEDVPVPEANPSPAQPEPEPAGLEMDATLNLNATLDFGPEPVSPPAAAPSSPEPSPGAAAREPVDRRIGRWTSRKSSKGEDAAAESKP